MGISSSKESSSSPLWRNLIFSPVSRTRCDEPALPALFTPGQTPPPPSEQESLPPPDLPKDSIAEAAEAVSLFAIPNPGPYEQASMDVKRLVSLDTHDGFRFDINKQLSPYMAIVHSFWLGTTSLPDGRTRTYSFLTQVADEKGLLMARVDPERGSVDGRIHRALLGGLVMAKLQLGVSANGQSDQALIDLDFGAHTWTSNIKYGSMGGGLIWGVNYFQSITPRLALGGEGMYIAANQNLLSNYTVKYTMPAPSGDDDIDITSSIVDSSSDKKEKGISMDTSSTLCANYNSGQGLVTMHYKRIVTPSRVTLGAELQFSPMSLESQVVLGAEFKLARSKIGVCVDGTYKVQSTLEAKLGMAPGSPTLSFAAEMDHAKDFMRFGYGINIEG